jgi:hypothetical protein
MTTTKTGLAHGDQFAATPGERVKVYVRLAEQAPAHRITLPDGKPAWLVTSTRGRAPEGRCVSTAAKYSNDRIV